MNREEIEKCEFAVYRKTGETASINYVDGRDKVHFFVIHKDRWPIISCDDENIGKPEDFDVCSFETISPEDFGRLVRAEIRCEELLDSHSFLPLFTVEGEYKTAAEDLLKGLNRLFEESWSMEDFMKWFNVIVMNYDAFGYDEDYEFRRISSLSESELLSYAILDLKFEYDFCDDFDDSLDLESFEKPSRTLEMLLSNRGKGIKDWQIPEEILKQYVLDQDNDELKNWSEEDKETYRFFLEKLAESEPKALQKMGYLIYTGDSIYKQDWPRCRDIFEKYYALTGDANAMNTLGYIYYYGRCNNGEGEYEKAFRCFSIGYAHGLYESSYKLGDMFAHGYGVVKNEDTAARLYWMVYNDSVKRFVNGEFHGQFADAALRVANMYKNGIGESENNDLALHYYLQADLAIRKRMETGDYYGDTRVFTGIQKSLAELLSGRKIRRSDRSQTPFVFYDILDGARRIRVRAKEEKDSSYKLTASYMKVPNEFRAPYIFFASIETGYCDLVEKITMKTSKGACVEMLDGTNEFIYNRIEDKRGIWCFYHDEKLTARIKTDGFIFKVPASRKVDEGKTVLMVSVRFSTNGRTYDYISDDETVEPGDRVIVNGYEGETEVEVVSVARKSEAELFVPLDRYKKIVRKV